MLGFFGIGGGITLAEGAGEAAGGVGAGRGVRSVISGWGGAGEAGAGEGTAEDGDGREGESVGGDEKSEEERGWYSPTSPAWPVRSKSE